MVFVNPDLRAKSPTAIASKYVLIGKLSSNVVKLYLSLKDSVLDTGIFPVYRRGVMGDSFATLFLFASYVWEVSGVSDGGYINWRPNIIKLSEGNNPEH